MLHGNLGSYPKHSEVKTSQKAPKRREAPRMSLKTKVKRDEISGLICDFLEQLDSPVALSTWLLYKSGEHRQLVERSINPHDYNNADTFRRDYAASRFLTKCADLDTGIDVDAVAVESAQKAEAQCQATNERFREWIETPDVSPDLTNLIPRVADRVSSILGVLRPGMFSDAGWSSGRTSSAFGDYASPLFKYGARLDSTLSCIPIAASVVGSSHHWGQAALEADGPVSVLPSAFTPVMGNTMITVPKNAKTARTICYEPHANIRLQLSVGDYMRKRLMRVGVNLNDQSINQRRARLGSKTGHFATIDLRSASDTVATLPLMSVIPVDWFSLLDALRSKYTFWPDGQWRENQKFSSMGNGFTFELESLLFFSICNTITDNVSVYGDDLIVPTDSYEACVHALQLFGFQVNTSKSFSTSYFRESCGFDGFRGFDVTPVYLRRLPKTMEEVLKLHNAIRLWASRDLIPLLSWSRLLAKWRKLHPFFTGPSGYGDGHYHVDFDERPKASYGIDGWWFKTVGWSYPSILDGICNEHGHFRAELGAHALSAALGPKRMIDVSRSIAYRKHRKERQIRALANFSWPTVLWT